MVSRSDDNGASWTELLRYRAGDSGGVRLSALTYDPAAPDRVYVGLNAVEKGVRTSADGGATWNELGLGDRDVRALELGIDARNLYAATDQGVWRLRLLPPS